jgi:type II secretory pathway pseudopilin PulG
MRTSEAPARRRGQRSEQGYTLAAVLVIVTILAMVLAYTIPDQWSFVMKREREIHAIWVMKQYARAIQEFQRKRGTFPVSLEQLTEQKNPRIIRQLYPNPLTGELDWILVPLGTPTPATTQGAAAPGTPPVPQPTPGAPPAQAGGGPGAQVGPFIGVRLPISGESVVPLNGLTKYEEWMYTINELQRDQGAATAGAPGVPPGAPPGTPAPPPGSTPNIPRNPSGPGFQRP